MATLRRLTRFVVRMTVEHRDGAAAGRADRKASSVRARVGELTSKPLVHHAEMSNRTLPKRGLRSPYHYPEFKRLTEAERKRAIKD